jgi:hypothetical protein
MNQSMLNPAAWDRFGVCAFFGNLRDFAASNSKPPV